LIVRASQPARLLVDTGAFLTTFDEGFLKSLGLASEPTRVSAHFFSGARQRMSAAAINDLKIGNFNGQILFCCISAIRVIRGCLQERLSSLRDLCVLCGE
jgi:hypothetical protein